MQDDMCMSSNILANQITCINDSVIQIMDESRKQITKKCIALYVIVIVQLSGIYGSKRTESEGDSPRTRFVYVAINP